MEDAQSAAVPKNIEKVSAGPETADARTNAVVPLAASLTAAPASGAPAPEAVTGSSVEQIANEIPASDAGQLPEDLTLAVPDTVATAEAEIATVGMVVVEPAMPTVPTDQPLLAALGDETTVPLPTPESTILSVPEAPAAADCTPVLSLSTAPRAMIAVRLLAPCNAGERVVLRHAGLAIAEKLDAQGKLAITLPALTATAEVSVLLVNADFAHAEISVPDAANTRRFAVQWMADDSFQLHAMEAGATYGDPGHVSAETPVSHNGSYLLSLGDPGVDLPMMAEVFTWPTDTTISVQPVIEAAITDRTCDRELLGETILADAGKTTTKDLTVSMPGCDAVGDILVLNNLLGDVTLAAAN
jgi:hypothetical protein